MSKKWKRLRIAVAFAVLVAAIVAGHTQGGAVIGTLCVLCPVGFAQIALAARSIPWELVPGVVAVLVAVFLLGRAFCSWLCPSQLLKNVFGGHRPRGLRGRSGAEPQAGGEPAGGASSCRVAASGVVIKPAPSGRVEAGEHTTLYGAGAGEHAASRGSEASAGGSPQGTSAKASACGSGCAACHEGGSQHLGAQAVVLVVLLVVSFIVHFPVFCLLCPIGLVFGTLWALNRVFVLLQPGWELVLFPLMLMAELFLFKRWCTSVCPLGFVFGLVCKLRARLRVGLRPSADCATCISKNGCRTCSTVCPEDIDVPRAVEQDKLAACTMCLDCMENCPTKSIQLKLRDSGAREDETVTKG